MKLRASQGYLRPVCMNAPSGSFEPAVAEVPLIFTKQAYKGNLATPTSPEYRVDDYGGSYDNYFFVAEQDDDAIHMGTVRHLLRSKRMPRLTRARISFHYKCGTFVEETDPKASA